MIENYKNIGTIDFTKTDKVVIIDPCYNNNDIPILGVKLPILKGIYNAYIQIEDCREWGVRVKNLVIINKKYDLNILENNNEEFNGFACVDSGTMSIFDLREYRKYHSNKPENTELNDEWYNLSLHKNLIINNKVIKTELTNSNDLFIWLENEIQLQIFISNGFPHYVEDCEQWRIFENDGDNMPHTVVYSNCIQEE